MSNTVRGRKTMENTKTTGNEKPRAPYYYSRCVEWMILAVMLVGIVVVSLFEAGVFTIPSEVIQKTGDNAIYQTLFAAQASMVGVALAILALMTNIIESNIYGMSVAQYTMKIRPIIFFRHGWIIIETIVLIALTWTCVALNLNNIAIALFVVTTILLIRLTCDVLGIMYSKQHIDKEIENYIMSNADSVHIVNLFNEINEAVISGNAVLLQYDIDFAKTMIKEKASEMSDADMAILSDLFSTIIHTTYESNSSKTADILDLYITAVEAASDTKKSFSLPNIFSTHEVFQLVSKTPILHLHGATGKTLLFRWQKAVLASITLSNAENSNIGHIASLLYSFAYKNNIDASTKTGITILADAQFIQNDNFRNNNGISKEVAENNYLGLIMSFFKERDERLLNTLLGFDGRDVGISFTPLYRQHRDFVLTKTNIFIVIYLFYLSFREASVPDDEKSYYKNVLHEIAPSFWISVNRYAHQFPAMLSDVGDAFEYFNKMLGLYERRGEFSYGSSGVRTVVYEDVVLDFTSFSLASLSVTGEQLESLLKTILLKERQWPGASLFTAFNRYVINGALEEHKQFRTIMQIHNYSSTETAETEYDKLKNALTSLYVRERIEQTTRDSLEFSPKQSGYEQAFNKTVSIALSDFSSQYACFNDGDNPLYKPYPLSFRVLITDREIPTELEEYGEGLAQQLGTFLFSEIKNNLKLTKESRANVTVSSFFNAVSKIEGTDLLFGYPPFHYNDPDYEKYLDFQEDHKQVDIYDSPVIAVANSQLIKVDIRNTTVKIRNHNIREIEYYIKHDKVLSVNGYPIPMDYNDAQDYLKNSWRVIEINLRIAIEATEMVVGGGLLFEDAD